MLNLNLFLRSFLKMVVFIFILPVLVFAQDLHPQSYDEVPIKGLIYDQPIDSLSQADDVSIYMNNQFTLPVNENLSPDVGVNTLAIKAIFKNFKINPLEDYNKLGHEYLNKLIQEIRSAPEKHSAEKVLNALNAIFQMYAISAGLELESSSTLKNPRTYQDYINNLAWQKILTSVSSASDWLPLISVLGARSNLAIVLNNQIHQQIERISMYVDTREFDKKNVKEVLGSKYISDEIDYPFNYNLERRRNLVKPSFFDNSFFKLYYAYVWIDTEGQKIESSLKRVSVEKKSSILGCRSIFK